MSLSKAIESFFQYATAPALVFCWIIVSYGAGSSLNSAGYGIATFLLIITIIVAAVLAVVGYRKDLEREDAKKAHSN